MSYNEKMKKAFSLIELMIVITIIGILAAVAVPAYQNYVVRAKVATAISLLNGLKTPIAEMYQTNGQFLTTGLQTSYGTIGNQAIVAVSGSDITNVYYSAKSKSLHAAVEMKHADVPGSSATNGISSGRWVYIGAVADASGNLTFSCGYWGGTRTWGFADLTLYPSGCNDRVQTESKWDTNG